MEAREAHLQAGAIVSCQRKWPGRSISEPEENSVIVSFLGDRTVICHSFSKCVECIHCYFNKYWCLNPAVLLQR